MDKMITNMSDATLSKLVDALGDATREMKESFGEKECLSNDVYVSMVSLDAVISIEYMRRERVRFFGK